MIHLNFLFSNNYDFIVFFLLGLKYTCHQKKLLCVDVKYLLFQIDLDTNVMFIHVLFPHSALRSR